QRGPCASTSGGRSSGSSSSSTTTSSVWWRRGGAVGTRRSDGWPRAASGRGARRSGRDSSIGSAASETRWRRRVPWWSGERSWSRGSSRGCPGAARCSARWVVLGWVVLGWVVLGWVVLGWVFLGWASLGWGCQGGACPERGWPWDGSNPCSGAERWAGEASLGSKPGCWPRRGVGSPLTAMSRLLLDQEEVGFAQGRAPWF